MNSIPCPGDRADSLWIGPGKRSGGWPFGAPLNLVAIAFVAFICVVLVLPPNEPAGKTLAVLLVSLGVLYAAVVRRRFKGLEWRRQGDERS